MDPVDDILIPRSQPPPNARRLTSRHILRVLAVILIAAALVYAGRILQMDRGLLASQRKADLLATVPIFLFGSLLWWYAGRQVDELARPLFRKADDAPSEMRLDLRNVFWLGASLMSGLVGMAAIIIGATLAWRGNDLKKAMPEFFAHLEKGMPRLQSLETATTPLILTGVLLMVLALATFALAVRRREPAPRK